MGRASIHPSISLHRPTPQTQAAVSWMQRGDVALQPEPSRSVVLALCGLPGAGKTTLAHRLAAWLPRQRDEADEAVEVLYVGFDDIEGDLRGDDEEWSLDAWRAARVAAFEQARRHLKERARPTKEEEQEKSARCRASRSVVILDDNMYYRSMRREAFKLAVEYGAGYACVWVDAPLEVAAARNRARREAAPAAAAAVVSEATLQRMHARLEPPAPEAHSWEAKCVRIDAAGEETDEDVTRILAAIKTGWSHPATIQQQGLGPEELAAARQQTRENAMHATDLALRKVVASVMAAAASANKDSTSTSSTTTTSTSRTTALGAGLSKAKGSVLKEVGSGSLPTVDPLAGERVNEGIVGVLTERLFAAAVRANGDGDHGWEAWLSELQAVVSTYGRR